MSDNVPSISPITLPPGFLESERGNTMLVSEDGVIQVFIKVAENTYLDISDSPGNYPRFYCAVVQQSAKELREWILECFAGFSIVRWSIDDNPPVTLGSLIPDLEDAATSD